MNMYEIYTVTLSGSKCRMITKYEIIAKIYYWWRVRRITNDESVELIYCGYVQEITETFDGKITKWKSKNVK